MSIYGTNGNDNINGTNGADISIFGYDGDDVIDGNGGDDIIDAGAGNDEVRGGTGNDVILGRSGDDILFGNEGNDTLFGEGGNDFLNGGSVGSGDGVDFLYGDEGDDTLFGDSKMYGGTGNDTYIVFSDNTQNVYENAGEGIDEIFLSADTYSLPTNIENLTLQQGNVGVGNDLSNTITGNSLSNYLDGLDGNDFLDGKGGDDYLYGGNGNDLIFGGTDNDYISGEADNDYLYGDTGNDTLLGDDGDDSLNGYQPRSYGEKDILTGGNGADSFGLGYNSSFFSSQIGYYGDGDAGYATIIDFKYWEGDKVRLGGNIDNYTIDGSINFSGASTLDIGLYYNSDLIAVLQDSPSFILSLDTII
jgi:Ca2+-binding RTX toxin-like protein